MNCPYDELQVLERFLRIVPRLARRNSRSHVNHRRFSRNRGAEGYFTRLENAMT